MKLTNLKIIIIDDEPDILNIIASSVENLFKSHAITCHCEKYSDGNEFLKKEKDASFDIVFLDIDMPCIDGIQLAQKIIEKDSSTTIIFVSNREDRVFETFEVRPYGFVRKTHFLTDITKIINHYILEMEKKEEEKRPKLIIQTDGQQFFVQMEKIIFIESYGHEQTFHLEDEKLTARDTMANIDFVTKKYGFKRVHKSYIINLSKVKAIVKDGVIMSDSSFVPINRKKISKFRQEYLKQLQFFDYSDEL
ncbi:MAG TPA: response regulator transcription factor [Erysipelotrichaceae bacterium]|nr:response regulator transcription factor [Erysipelotrichaceae bacterium]